MKRYKLLKDLPTFRAGDLFELRDDGCLYWVRGWRNPDEVKYYDKEVIAYHKNTLKFFPNILTDWFNEIEEPTRWKPEMGQTYYHVGGDGWVYDDTRVNYSAVDNGRFEIGNCFKTVEEAERAVEYLKALAVVRGDATSEFIKYNDNWFIGYDPEHKSIDAFCNPYTARNGIFGLPYFATSEDALRSIDLHKKEWLTIFGVKEEG